MIKEIDLTDLFVWLMLESRPTKKDHYSLFKVLGDSTHSNPNIGKVVLSGLMSNTRTVLSNHNKRFLLPCSVQVGNRYFLEANFINEERFPEGTRVEILDIKCSSPKEDYIVVTNVIGKHGTMVSGYWHFMLNKFLESADVREINLNMENGKY